MTLCVVASVAPPPPPPSSVVFEAGVDAYPNIRIPSILQLKDGTLLAFAEGRQGGDHAQNDIILKRSNDGGVTWGALQVIDDQGGDSLNDPLPVEVRSGPHAGRVYLFYMSFPEGCHTSCVDVGYGPNSSHNWMSYSDDSGKTWSTPADLTKIVRRESSNYAGSPGVGIQLRHGPHPGRLLIPLRQGPINEMNIYALYSDDGGDTWLRGDLIDNGSGGGVGDETSIAELDDGTILLNARAHNGAPTFRKTSRSTDGGITWAPLTNDENLITPHCMASIVLMNPIDSFAKSRLLYAGPWTHFRPLQRVNPDLQRRRQIMATSQNHRPRRLCLQSTGGTRSPRRCRTPLRGRELLQDCVHASFSSIHDRRQ